MSFAITVSGLAPNGGYQSLIDWGTPSPNNYIGLNLHPDGTIWVDNGTTSWNTGYTPDTGAHTYVVTVDGSGNAVLYVDGTSVAGPYSLGRQNVTLNGYVQIGTDANHTQPATCMVSNAAIWSQCLSPTDAATATSDGPGAVTFGLVRCWPLQNQTDLAGVTGTSSTLEPEGTAPTPTQRSITYDVLDNLGEVTSEDVYAGNGVALVYTDGVPEVPSGDASLLRSETVSQYNAQGIDYDDEVEPVDQSTGDVDEDGVPRDTKTLYDVDGNLTGTIDPSGNVTATTYNDDDQDVADYRGQTHYDLRPRILLFQQCLDLQRPDAEQRRAASTMSYNVYVESATTVSGYTVEDAAGNPVNFAATKDPTAPSLGGWQFLGTVSVAADATPSLKVLGGSPAVEDVCLLQQTSATLYDPDGNVAATTDADGSVTATTYDRDGEDIADYQGQVVNSVADAPGYSSSGPTWTFSNLSPNSTLTYEVYVLGGSGSYTAADAGNSSIAPTRGGDALAPTLGGGWVDEGSVTVSPSTSWVTLSGAAAGQVCLLQRTSATVYDAIGDVTAATDSLGRVTATDYDPLGQDTADYQGQIVNSITGAPGYATCGSGPTAASNWTFSKLSPNNQLSYDVYVYSANGSADTSQDNYSLSGASFLPQNDPAAPSLGAGWSLLGTLSASASTVAVSRLTDATGLAPGEVCLMQQTSATAYDPNGNVTAQIDGTGRVTASAYNDMGDDTADYQGQVLTNVGPSYTSSGAGAGTVSHWAFSNLVPNSFAAYEVYGYSTAASYGGSGFTAGGNAARRSPLRQRRRWGRTGIRWAPRRSRPPRPH